MIHLKTRRFLCESSSCPRKILAERFPELAVPYGRRTLLLRRTLETMALALGGRPAVASLDVCVSRSLGPRCYACFVPCPCPKRGAWRSNPPRMPAPKDRAPQR
jgi:hypothetical protein